MGQSGDKGVILRQNIFKALGKDKFKALIDFLGYTVFKNIGRV